MQKLISFNEAAEVLDDIDIEVEKRNLLKEHLNSHKMASFELYAGFDLCSFSWYDISSHETDTSRIII